MLKTCAWCGKEYETENFRRKYCCKECLWASQGERKRLSRGERRARRKRLAEERRRDLEVVLYPKRWMKMRGFI